MYPDSAVPILIYGNSPLLTTAEILLRGRPVAQVIHIDPTHPTAMQQLSALGDGVLIYDCRRIDPELIKAIHMLYSHITTVGLGGGRGEQEVMLLGRLYPPATIESLAQVLALVSGMDANI